VDVYQFDGALSREIPQAIERWSVEVRAAVTVIQQDMFVQELMTILFNPTTQLRNLALDRRLFLLTL
jgi:hypothetical protein